MTESEALSVEERCKMVVIEIVAAQGEPRVGLTVDHINRIIDNWALDEQDRVALGDAVWEYVNDPRSKA